MIESILHNNRLLGLYCFALGLSLRLVEKAFLLGSFVLWPVLQQHLEQAGCCLLHHFSPLLSTNTKMQMIVQAQILTLVHWKKTKVRETRQRNRFSRKRHSPRFLSRVFVNWLSAGGTLRRWFRTRRCLCILTYLGHFTNLCKSLLGGRAPPIPNCLGRFSNKGLATFATFSGACISVSQSVIYCHETPRKKQPRVQTPAPVTNSLLETMLPFSGTTKSHIHTFFFSTACGMADLRVPFLGACNKGRKGATNHIVSSHIQPPLASM